jgi:hypothetical protein
LGRPASAASALARRVRRLVVWLSMAANAIPTRIIASPAGEVMSAASFTEKTRAPSRSQALTAASNWPGWRESRSSFHTRIASIAPRSRSSSIRR